MDMTVASPEGPSLRERKKSATRAALRRAAVELVSTRGLASVTVEDIAAAADVSARTFFNYFSSKEDAISGFDPAALAELVALLRERPAGEPPALALRAAMLEAPASVDAHPRELLLRLQLVRSDPHLLAHYASAWAETERQLVAALAERRGEKPHHDSYLSLVVAATLTASRVAMLSWCESGGRGRLVDEVQLHLDILGAGLAEPDRSERGSSARVRGMSATDGDEKQRRAAESERKGGSR